MSVYTPITGNPSYKLVFDDEFNGTSLDTSKWYPPVTQHDNTYANTNMAEMIASNVSVNNGVLDMKVTPGPTPNGSQYGTAAITSKGTTIPGEPINVYWEARIKNMDKASGLTSGFWTDTASNFNFPEVDFDEYWQSYTANATGQHYNDGNTWVLSGEGASTGSDLGAGYHVYGCLWTPTSIKFYVDGVLTAQTTTNTSQTVPEWYAILNATAGGGGIWPNGTAQVPNDMYVDYVHVYSAQPGAVAVTPEAGYGGPGDNATGSPTPPPVTSPGGTTSPKGPAHSDFNGDGKSDILWQNTNGQASIWEMNGTNVIAGATGGANPGPSWKAIGTGDFNGDGHADILWQNTSGQASIWEMNGMNVINEASVGANPGPSWKIIGTGDFNGDGHSDILWQNTSGQASIWEMNGTNIINEANVSGNPGASWHVIKA
jgi:beta-glucanase (GH16 family)